MATFDLLIRGGTIVDGSGGPAFKGDVGIVDGVISAVGRIGGSGRETIDAGGMLVTPGFIDPHTHYDGQVTWENTLTPSSGHGVTTVAMGNCGVGFAPCKADERSILVKIMEGVEDVPEIVMTEGIPWAWETFPEYLDFVAKRRFDADCAAFLPHAALRVFVMGRRAAGGTSTPEERAEMTRLVVEAMEAGAIGVSTSRALFHRDSAGNLAPHVESGRLELLALAEGLRVAGRGVFQMITGLLNQQLKEFDSTADDAGDKIIYQEVELMRDLSRASGRPVHFTLTDVREAPSLYHRVLDLIAEENANGATIKAQIFPRPVGLLYGLQMSLHPFKLHPSYKPLDGLPLVEKVARMRDPEVRARILSEELDADHPSPVVKFLVSRSLESYPWRTEADYEPAIEEGLIAVAERKGLTVQEAAYDALLEDDGKSILYLPMVNFAGNNLVHVHEMMSHPDALLGLGDGGAHYGLICDASYPTFVLTYWTRDRDGPRISIPEAVEAMTRRPALALGMEDRGLIATGFKADINVIDYDNLKLHLPTVTHSLPAQGRRIVQPASGYIATIVDGEITYRHGMATGARPGRLTRLAPCCSRQTDAA